MKIQSSLKLKRINIEVNNISRLKKLTKLNL